MRESRPARCEAGSAGIAGEAQARLDAEHAAQIIVPVLLLSGEKSEAAKGQVDALAAMLLDAQRLVLAGQQHVADILDRRLSRNTCWDSCEADNAFR